MSNNFAETDKAVEEFKSRHAALQQVHRRQGDDVEQARRQLHALSVLAGFRFEPMPGRAGEWRIIDEIGEQVWGTILELATAFLGERAA
ncbi:MAG TPA: hypothetical protein VHZ03_05350 [Trebonia sp.]|jgi:hypothetical protein|nr:hypothetical protein [Trebonia sp.]